MDALVSRASMIWLSLQPSPASEASAFNKIRAFIRRCAGPRPFRVSATSCSRSSPFNRTTYFFTIISFAAMIASVVRVTTKANHQIVSNWLKRSTRTGKEIRAFKGHEYAVYSVAFGPDGARVLTGSRDGTARLWDAATGKEIRAFTGHEEAVLSVAFSPDGARVLTGSEDKTGRLWDAGTGKEIR